MANKDRTTKEAPLVVTVKEFAGSMKLSLNTAYAVIHRGQVPHIRLGGRILVPKSAVDRLLNQ